MCTCLHESQRIERIQIEQWIQNTYCTNIYCYRKEQKDSSTIDGNVEFVHSQYSCILTSQVSI